MRGSGFVLVHLLPIVVIQGGLSGLPMPDLLLVLGGVPDFHCHPDQLATVPGDAVENGSQGN